MYLQQMCVTLQGLPRVSQRKWPKHPLSQHQFLSLMIRCLLLNHSPHLEDYVGQISKIKINICNMCVLEGIRTHDLKNLIKICNMAIT